jgi:hypothetical protein
MFFEEQIFRVFRFILGVLKRPTHRSGFYSLKFRKIPMLSQKMLFTKKSSGRIFARACLSMFEVEKKLPNALQWRLS